MSGADILRPADTSLQGRLMHWFFMNQAAVFRFARRVWPIPKLGVVAVTRYDDVMEVFRNDPAFRVPYADNLSLIMGGEPFFLGMDDTAEYRLDVANMRAVVLAEDLPVLAASAAQQAEALLDAAGGRVDVVDYTRQVTFGVLGPYFGITPPADGDLQLWATRLFEFQFTYAGKIGPGVTDPMYLEAARLAPLMLAHVDALIAARRASAGPDDVLQRCLARQAAGAEGYTDAKIRSALVGFLVGGPPQPPMVLPFAVEQLLEREPELALAAVAARHGDTATVARYLFEAMRFDPLAPLLQRKTVADTVVAAGTPRSCTIKAGTRVAVCFASAMRDPRRIADPARFDITRGDSDYVHFGFGLHRCFGEAINHAMLPVILQALLKRGIRRAPGPAGRLVKRGIFADTLWVEY